MKNLLLNKSTLTAVAVLALLSPSFVGAMSDPDIDEGKKVQQASAAANKANDDLKQAKKNEAAAQKGKEKQAFSQKAEDQKDANEAAGGKHELTRNQQNEREVERLGEQAKSTVNKVGKALGLK